MGFFGKFLRIFSGFFSLFLHLYKVCFQSMKYLDKISPLIYHPKSLRKNTLKNETLYIAPQINKGTDLYYGILLEVGRWWWSSISMMTNLTIGGLVVMNFSRSLLLMTTLFLVFAKRLCSLFPEFSFYFVLNSKVDQLSRKQQKKKSWAEKRNVTKILPFDKHLIHQRFVL